MNLARLLWSLAGQRGEHAAIVDAGGEMSYAMLRRRACNIAGALHRAGVGVGDRVAVFLERGADAAATIFAAYAAGAVAVVLNERLRSRQVEYAIKHVDARALVTSQSLISTLAPHVGTIVTIVDAGSVPMEPCEMEPIHRDAGDLAQLVFTSGSTGLPKAVVFTHGALGAGVENVSSYLGLRSTDRVAGLLAFSGVYGLNQLLCTVKVGATLVIENSPLPNVIAETARRHGVTVLAAVPPLWVQLLGAPAFTRAHLTSLRQMQNAGGHLPVSVVRSLRASQPHADLILQYGQTETFRGSYLAPSEVDQRPDSMGKAIPGAELLVVGDDGRPCRPGEPGELVHIGPTIARGYWNNEEATNRVFREHPTSPSAGRAVYSGDIVRQDEDGFLYFVSRRDRLIKSLGFRVGPDEIADVLYASGQVNECVIDSESDPMRGERIVAYVVLRADASVDQLKRACGVELPRYMQPARFVVVEAIPRLPGGKFDIGALRALPRT